MDLVLELAWQALELVQLYCELPSTHTCLTGFELFASLEFDVALHEGLRSLCAPLCWQMCHVELES